MMKCLIGLVLAGLFAGVFGTDTKLLCQVAPADVPKEWITMTSPCVKKMREQVQAELEAAMTYLAMGAHFYRDTINRPGFGDYFFHSAGEEREHTLKIIEYLLMRGELTQDVRELIDNPKPLKTEWPDAVTALRDALKLEITVTEKIRGIISACENPGEGMINDYHLVDYLSSDFLGEQHKGQRELAGHISDLGKMMDSQGVLGEFLYDKKLQDMRVAV